MNSMGKVVALLAPWGLVVGVWGVTTTLAQEPPVVVEGQVTNATAQGGSVSGLPVVLHQESTDRHQNLETVTDAEGRFRFEGVVFVPDLFYGVSVQYQGALYGQDVDLSSGSPPPISLTVYEATDKEEVLSASVVSVLFSGVDRATETLGVLEIVTLGNTADRTYVPGPEPMKLLRFGLPPGAQDLRVESGLLGAGVVQVDRGFALTASVPPGEHQIMYTYRFPYSGVEGPFAKSLPYGAGRLRMLAPEGMLQLSSSQLGSAEIATIGQRSYRLLEASDLPRGLKVTVGLSGLPQASFWDRLSQRSKGIPFEYIAPAGLGLLVVFLLGFSVWRQAGKRRPAFGASGVSALATRRQALVETLADLQRRFESGTLTEEDYQRRRNELKARLVAVLRQGG